nr:odorant-binding protein 10 [Podabrus annulatus]
MYLPIKLIILLALITLNDGESKVNLKSKTLEDSKHQSNGSRTDPMKAEIKKYLPECGGESSDDENSDSSRYPRTGQKYGNNQDDDDQYGQSSHGHHQNNRHNNDDNDRYGQDSSNRNNGRDSNRNHRGESSNRNNGRESMNRNFGGDSSSNRNYGGHSSGRDYGGESSNRNYGRDSSRNSGGFDRSGQGNGGYGGRSGHGNGGYDRSGHRNGNDENDGYGSRNYDGYDSRNRESSSGSGRYGSGSDRHGYGYSGGYLRSKRSDNMECISQCVFGYLEVLDDNRSPSESALLKWIQDNLPNDAKRIKAVRETRRCFARLVSSDTSDGCEFSKSLSNCMRLGIEN